MEPIVGDEVLSHRHILSLKALQPLLALVSDETDEEQCLVFECYKCSNQKGVNKWKVLLKST